MVEGGQTEGRTVTREWSPASVDVRAIVFDLFYTLVDPNQTKPADFDRVTAISEILGVDTDLLGQWWDERIAEFAVTPLSPVDELVDLARQRRIVMSPGDVADVDRALGRYQDEALRNPVKGVLGTISRIRRAQVGVGLLSNAHTRDVRAWSDSPLAVLVDEACISCFIGAAKPDVRSYEVVLCRLGVDAGDALFVGDGGSEEFAGAREAGFGGVIAVSGLAIRSGFRTREEMDELCGDADVEVGEITELIPLLGIPD